MLFLLIVDLSVPTEDFVNSIAAYGIIYGMYVILTTILFQKTLTIIITSLRERKNPPLHYANIKDKAFDSILEVERDAIARLETRLGSPVGVLNAPREAGLTDPDCGYLAVNEHITHISLRDRKLDEIPIEIKVFTHLQSLDLQGNHIHQLSDWFHTFQLLECLNLSRNGRINLPESLLHLPNLHSLTLSNPIGNYKVILQLRQSGITVNVGKWWSIIAPVIFLVFYASIYIINYFKIVFPSISGQDYLVILLFGFPLYFILCLYAWNGATFALKKIINYFK